jgi:hypothetical protein
MSSNSNPSRETVPLVTLSFSTIGRLEPIRSSEHKPIVLNLLVPDLKRFDGKGRGFQSYRFTGKEGVNGIKGYLAGFLHNLHKGADD